VQMPNIRTSMRDSNGTLFHVVAYRQLSRAETIHAIGFYNSHKKRSRKKPASVTIITSLGAFD